MGNYIGRNLLRFTRTFDKRAWQSRTYEYLATQNVERGYTDDGFIYIHSVAGDPKTETEDYRWIDSCLCKNFKFEPNTVYTLSFYAKGTSVESYCYPNVNAKILTCSNSSTIYSNDLSDTACKHILSNKYQRYFVTFKTLSSLEESSNILIRTLAKNESWVYGIKLEKGYPHNLTWTAAIEDNESPYIEKNFIVGTSNEWGPWMTPTYNVINTGYNSFYIFDKDIRVGDKYTVCLDVEFKDVTINKDVLATRYPTNNIVFCTQGTVNGSWYTKDNENYTRNPFADFIIQIKDGEIQNKVYHGEIHTTVKDNYHIYKGDIDEGFNQFCLGVRCDAWASGQYRIKSYVVKKNHLPNPVWVPHKIETANPNLYVKDLVNNPAFSEQIDVKIDGNPLITHGYRWTFDSSIPNIGANIYSSYIEPGTPMTVSFYARGTAKNMMFYTRKDETTNVVLQSIYLNLTEEWQQYSITNPSTTNTNYDISCAAIHISNGWCEIAGFKVENGIKATEYVKPLQVDTITKTIRANAYSTICSPFEITIPTDIISIEEVYVHGAPSTYDITFNKGISGFTKIPAGRPVLLHNKTDNDYTFSVTKHWEINEPPAICKDPINPYIRGLFDAITLSGEYTEDGKPYNVYVMQTQNGTQAFYQIAEGTSMTATKFACYVAIPKE